MGENAPKKSMMSKVLDFIGLQESDREKDAKRANPAQSSENSNQFGQSDKYAGQDGGRQPNRTGQQRGTQSSADQRRTNGSPNQGRGNQANASANRTGNDEFWGSSGKSAKSSRDSAQPSNSSGQRRSDSASSAPERTERYEAENAPRSATVERSYSDQHKMDIFQVKTFEECRDIIVALLDRKSVLINLELLDDSLIQRSVDTLGGAAFAIRANIKKVTSKVYIIAPPNVVVSINEFDTPQSARRYF